MTLSREEAGWVEFLSQFGINKLTLQKERIHVLGDALSRVPHAPTETEVNNTEVLTVNSPDNFHNNYSSDATFGPIYRALHGKLSSAEYAGHVSPNSSIRLR